MCNDVGEKPSHDSHRRVARRPADRLKPKSKPKLKQGRRKIKEDLEPIDGRLIRNPPPKAVAPYTAKNELEDSYLRFLLHHCQSPQPLFTCTRLTNCRCDGGSRAYSRMCWAEVGMVSPSRERSCLLQCPYLFDFFTRSIPAAS